MSEDLQAALGFALGALMYAAYVMIREAAA